MRVFFAAKGGNEWARRNPERTKEIQARARERRRGLPPLESKRQAWERRRAIKIGVTVERFSRSEIFERDKWICGICREPVDQALTYPDPLSASLDHIVPLSAGGAHSRNNTQLAHLACNVRKGARTVA